MMTAKEMFEELGFVLEKQPYYEKCIWYKTNDDYFNREIKFWLDSKIIYNNLVYGDFTMNGSCPINTKLIKAINKQIEELHWNDEK